MAFDHQRQVKLDAGTRTSDWSTRIETKLFVYVHLCTDGDALPRLAADSSHPPTTAPSQIYKIKMIFKILSLIKHQELWPNSDQVIIVGPFESTFVKK